MPGKFLKVRCKKCKNEQVVFNKASTEVKCLVCGATLTKPTGGKAKVKATIIKTFK
jgi:small subunit ribosomal protein S27e